MQERLPEDMQTPFQKWLYAYEDFLEYDRGITPESELPSRDVVKQHLHDAFEEWFATL